MSLETTKPFLDQHARLRGQVEHLPVAAHELPRLEVVERVEMIERIVAFLAEILLPHCQLEERVLYPGAARLLGEPDGSDSIGDDRERVRRLLTVLAEADPRDVGRIQETLFGLYLLLTTHLQKEEEIYVKLVGTQPDELVRQLLASVTAA